MKKRRGVCSVSILIFYLLFSRGGWAAEPLELRINSCAVRGAFAPVWVAPEEGLFARYGLKTDLKLIPAELEGADFVEKLYHA